MRRSTARGTFPARASPISIATCRPPKTGRNGRHPLPTPEACAALFGRLGIDADKQVVAYDSGGGMYAPHVWWMLRWLGHDAVAVLDGGFGKWVREGRPVTTEIPAVRPATFAVRRVGPFLSADDVLASLEGRRITLIDARGAERYRGDVEPLDPVAGHIPGAINRPYTQNVEADGTFKSPEKLRAELAAVTGNAPPATIVNYCGSGVSACHNLLAMEIAGIARDDALPRLVERMVRRSGAPGRARSRVVGQRSGAAAPVERPARGVR